MPLSGAKMLRLRTGVAGMADAMIEVRTWATAPFGVRHVPVLSLPRCTGRRGVAAVLERVIHIVLTFMQRASHTVVDVKRQCRETGFCTHEVPSTPLMKPWRCSLTDNIRAR
jgi:hypothetical protein